MEHYDVPERGDGTSTPTPLGRGSLILVLGAVVVLFASALAAFAIDQARRPSGGVCREGTSVCAGRDLDLTGSDGRLPTGASLLANLPAATYVMTAWQLGSPVSGADVPRIPAGRLQKLYGACGGVGQMRVTVRRGSETAAQMVVGCDGHLRAGLEFAPTTEVTDSRTRSVFAGPFQFDVRLAGVVAQAEFFVTTDGPD